MELGTWRWKSKDSIAIEEDSNGQEENVAEEVEELHVVLCAGAESTLSGSYFRSEVVLTRKC